jgi:hypothetical protein
MADDPSIRLTLPADPEYGRVARTAVAGLALRLGFPYLAIEDLRLAIDETLILLLRPGLDAARVTIRFAPTPEALVIDAHTDATTEAEADTEPAGATDTPETVEPPTPVVHDDSSGNFLRPLTEADSRRRFEDLVTPTVDAWSLDERARSVHLVKRRG